MIIHVLQHRADQFRAQRVSALVFRQLLAYRIDKAQKRKVEHIADGLHSKQKLPKYFKMWLYRANQSQIINAKRKCLMLAVKSVDA